jgi:hypothetical protein
MPQEGRQKVVLAYLGNLTKTQTPVNIFLPSGQGETGRKHQIF